MLTDGNYVCCTIVTFSKIINKKALFVPLTQQVRQHAINVFMFQIENENKKVYPINKENGVGTEVQNVCNSTENAIHVSRTIFHTATSLAFFLLSSLSN